MLFYLAHPVAADELHSFEDNKAHTLKVLRMAHEAGFKVVCPWWTDLHAFNDADEGERRERMEIDHELLPRFDGILLAGHKLSAGMKEEYDVMVRHHKLVVEMTGLSDERLKERLEEFARVGTIYGRGLGWRA